MQAWAVHAVNYWITSKWKHVVQKIEQIQEKVKEILIERPKREYKAIKRARGLEYELNYNIYFTELFEFVNKLISDPLTYNEATKSPLSKQWIKAIEEEINILTERNIWKYVYLLENANIIGTKFIYKTKKKADESINKFKARLVIQRYTQ